MQHISWNSAMFSKLGPIPALNGLRGEQHPETSRYTDFFKKVKSCKQ